MLDNNFNPSLVNGNSLSPHYITTPSPGHQSQYSNVKSDSIVNSNAYHELPPNESLKSASQHSVVANAAAGYFSRHTGNGLGNGQVTSQRLSGLGSNQTDNQLTNNGTNMYTNGPHPPPTYANPSLYYGSPNSTQQASPSSSINRNSGNRTTQPPQSSALQQQLIGTHPQQIQPQQYTASTNNSTTSPSLNVSHNSNNNSSMMSLSHRSKSVDLLNSNDNSNGSSSHSTSSLGQQIKMNNAQSPLNALLNNSNNSNNMNNTTPTSQTIKTTVHQPDAYFNPAVTSTTQLQQQQQQSTTPLNYYGKYDEFNYLYARTN